MILRVAKLAVILAVALFYTLVVFNNLTDYESNYQFASPRADDGFHVSWKSRYVARDELAGMAHRVLSFRSSLGSRL